jgi:hypothetical protein
MSVLMPHTFTVVDRTSRSARPADEDHDGGALPTLPRLEVRADVEHLPPNAGANERTRAPNRDQVRPKRRTCDVSGSQDRGRRASPIRDDGIEIRNDIQVIINVPADWSLPAPACQEILDVISAIARRASGTDDQAVAG